MKILIVEDSDSNRLLLERILTKAGYTDLESAASASEAYRVLRLDDAAGPATDVDLILMDILMPDVDGLTACRRIKRFPDLHDVPVIMVTAKGDIESLQAGFDAGAMDYITKPFQKPELLARVRSALTLKKETDRRKARELEIADIGARIQRSLLRAKPPEHLSGACVASLSIPSQRIDGDFYDFFQPAEDLLDILVADVMGKGVPAALLGAAAKTRFLQAAHRLVPRTDDCGSRTVVPPEAIVGIVHEEMTEELMELEAFITLCYARLDFARMRLRLIDCGHVRTLHYVAAEGGCRWIRGDNLPLGVLEGEALQPVEAALGVGDVLLFYSDGITEAQNPSGEFFGEDRLQESVEANAGCEPEALVERVCDAVRVFSGVKAHSDDLTCVAVRMSAL
ncbi:MAG: SpoIIE family protein phosphatase [Desulfobacteraceae bacterium]|nr:SpoIIE family protein phosphatase [Desulfobacteraceae bacterium]